MKVSEIFLQFPYYLTWKVQKLFDKKPATVDFYIGEVMDYYVMQGVIRRFPGSRIVAKNIAVRKELAKLGIPATLWPTFPDVVIMARHAMHEYPIKNVLKIGINHGPYVFKYMIKASKYNAFELFFMSSQEEVTLGEQIGVKSGVTVGYPKLDPAFNGEYNEEYLSKLRERIGLSREKKTILFSATWDKSGMSAIHHWYNRLGELTERYNVMVTLHPFMSKFYRRAIETTPGIYYIQDANSIPYLMLADVLVSDTSSIIAEYCSLDKPIVTFKVAEARRLTKEVRELISSISISIDTFDQISAALEEAIWNDKLSAQRQAANKRFFLTLDGKASERAAEKIRSLLQAHKLALPEGEASR